jgi:hypothetical protein
VLVTCWSVKGGSGTTVVAAALAVLLARRCADGALLVDLGGDAGAALGLPDATGPGIGEWLAAGPDVGADALTRLQIDCGGGLALLPRGEGLDAHPGRLMSALADRARGGRPVIVDAGPPSELSNELAAGATVSLLVLRPCYLAVRRALAAAVRPSAVVLIDEPDRSLQARDIEDVLGVPVRAVVPWDKAIARCVDAGLLRSRVPRLLASALRAAA